MDKEKGTKRVFVSYSWAVQKPVIELAERLIANGIDVVIDIYDLKEGQDKYAFMERCVNDPTIDNVLIICDKSYSDKANNREGGVGDETVIITPEIYGNAQQTKFIPIIFEKDEDGKAYCPQYIKSRIYIDLTDDEQYESEFEKLLRNIYEKPLFSKPALGRKPEWLDNETVDLSSVRDITKQIRGYSGGNPVKADFLVRKSIDCLISTAKQYDLPKEKPIDEGLLIAIDQYKIFRDRFIDYCEALIYSGLPVSDTLGTLFEALYNDLHNAEGKTSCKSTDFELGEIMIWELFINMTAVLLYYERYTDLFKLLVKPYFIRQSPLDSDVTPVGYFIFRKYFHIIEEQCKPKCFNPRLYTLSGNILVSREKSPILTKETISNADLVLYQLGTLLPVPKMSSGSCSCWFPTSYIYHREKQQIWQRMVSTAYCLKIAPLFGVKAVDELKEILKNSKYDHDMHYSGAFEAAPCILSSISIDKIASLY